MTLRCAALQLRLGKGRAGRTAVRAHARRGTPAWVRGGRGAAAAVIALALVAPARAQEGIAPDRIRGQIAKVEATAVVVQARDGKQVRVGLTDQTTVLVLTKASFTEVDFGKYVGAVSYQLGDDIYSPIRRDSLVWLHRGYELRIIDEELRGIALGFVKWDLTPESVMTHGWVDDIEDRVISIKFGPTDYDETDVEITRDTPVHRMSIGDRSLLKPAVRAMVGAHKGPDGRHVAQFIIIGKDGAAPAL